MRRTLPLILTAFLAACASSGESPQSGAATATATPAADPGPTRFTGRTLVYECDKGEFIARTGPGEMALWLDDRYVVLSQVRSGSGAKYQEGDTLFWSKGDTAILDDGDTHYRNCQLNPRRVPWEDARRRGVDFRATGNEPGWHLEVHEGDRLLFVGDYGATRHLFDNPRSDHQHERITYTASKGDDLIQVTAEKKRCQDTMQGDFYPMTVDVRLNEYHYRGCGMTLDHPWE